MPGTGGKGEDVLSEPLRLRAPFLCAWVLVLGIRIGIFMNHL